ncbi:MAG: RcpC/CpaB family pilus assembly protein [Peptococcaceae bacterium]|nr:RcpC/CpaB family pilus assembly protein [Peptococcaceae bacterium]
MRIRTSRSKAALAALIAALLLVGVNQVMVRAGIGDPVQAVAAVREIHAGQVVTAGDLQPVAIHGKVAGLASEQTAVNKVAVYDLAAGQLVMSDQVGDVPEREGLKFGEVGMRVPVDLVTSAGVVPGDRVDVVMAGKNQGQMNQEPQATVQTVEKNLRVVSVVNNSNQPVTTPVATGQSGALLPGMNAGLPAAVELAMTPAQAQQVALAETSGRLILVEDPWVGEPGGTATHD